MPRGGKRPGAGRKRTLSGQERLAVGALCERLWCGEWEAAQQKAIERHTKALRKEWQSDAIKWLRAHPEERLIQ